MYNRFITLNILLLVSLSFVSTQNCEDYDRNKCGKYTYSESDDRTKKCIYDYEVGKCQLKACSDYDITKCRNFDTHNYETACVPFNGVCQEKKCSDYKSPNCGDFIPSDLSKKCISKGNECEEVYKQCEEFSYNDCSSYYSHSEEVCAPKKDKSGCELKICSHLNSNECSDLTFDKYYLKICVPNEDNNGCKIMECSNIPKGNCNAFNDYFPSSNEQKCIEPEEETKSNCQEVFKSCEEFDHNNCIKFFTKDDEFDFEETRDFKRCIPKSDNTNCEIKKCSELSQNDCNRFNTLNLLEYTEQNRYNTLNLLEITEQCIAKKDNSGCEIKTCEEMPPDECGLITNDNFFWKCEKENDKCIVKIKECSQIPLSFCEIVRESGKNCHLNKSKNKCLSENDEDKDEENEETEKNSPNESDKDSPNESDKNSPNESNENKFIKLYLFPLILNLLIY